MSEVPTKIVPIDSISPHPENYNQHPESQIAELIESAESFGQYKNVVVWSPDSEIDLGNGQKLYPDVSYILAGHGFWLASRRAGRDTIEVKDYAGLPYEDALMLMQVDNAAPLGAQPDPDKLKVLLQKTRERAADRPKLGAMLARLRESAGVSENGEGARDEPPQEVTETEAEKLAKQYGVKEGSIFSLGHHRLFCGDCTNKEIVDRVMGEEKFSCLVTDPPYGVNYEGGRNPISNIPRERLEGDANPILYNQFLSIWKNYRANKGVLYIWFADRGGKPVYDAVIDNGFTIRALIIWNKLDPHYGNFMAQYLQKHEPCLYCVKDGTNWYGATNETTVWDIKQPNINEFHPTQKPLECMSKPIQNSSKVGDLIVDPFIGSGTTLLACESLGRKCVGGDISPLYVAVTIQRWVDLTHQDPVLLNE